VEPTALKNSGARHPVLDRTRANENTRNGWCVPLCSDKGLSGLPAQNARREVLFHGPKGCTFEVN